MYDLKWPSFSGPRSSILPPSILDFPPREACEQNEEASDDISLQFPTADPNNCISYNFLFLDSLCKFQSPDNVITTYGKIFSISVDLAIVVSQLSSSPIGCDHLDIISFLTRRNQTTAHTIILDVSKQMIDIGVTIDVESDHAGSSLQFDRISSAFERLLASGDDQSRGYLMGNIKCRRIVLDIQKLLTSDGFKNVNLNFMIRVVQILISRLIGKRESSLGAISSLLAQLCVKKNAVTPCLFEIQQLVRYNIIQDSVGTAKLLISASASSKSDGMYHLGIEMLERCGENERVVSSMIKAGRLIDACEYARDNNCMSSISASKVLEDAYNRREDEEKRLFKVVFGSLDAYGLIDLECDRYVSIMREMGEAIVMENI
jgi:hypothetical protein